MPEVARKTHGTKLLRDGTEVARLLNISPPEVTRDDMDVTDHDSPDGYKEYIPGLKDGGEVSIEGHLIPTDDTQKGLLAAVDINEPEPWTIEFPTVPKLRITFDGYVKSYKVGDAPVDDVMKFTAVIKVTGKPGIVTDDSEGLSALKVTGTNDLDLSPEFDKDVYEYFATADQDTVKVTPTADGHTITVNGATVESGKESGDITLTDGALTKITVKAAEVGKAPITYVIKVYYAGAI